MEHRQLEPVPYIDLSLQHRRLKDELLAATERILLSGGFVLGEEVAKFEEEFAAVSGTKYAVGVANGTDAITLCCRMLGFGAGDEIITAPNSFLASASGLVLAGVTPVFADVRDDYNLDPEQVERAITPRTRGILAVHLTGRPAPMRELQEVADRKGLVLIEDAAQAVGARYHDQPVGSLGRVACFSLHPLKNLSACGDGGMVTTNDADLYQQLIQGRNHGLRNRDECDFWSVNSRLDALQAALLRVKLKSLDRWTRRRREHARAYTEALSNVLEIPRELTHEYSVYHTFVVQTDRRDRLQEFLNQRGIGTKVHYPIPIHLQKAAQGLGYRQGDFPKAERQATRILSLPIFPELTDEQRQRVIQGVLEFR